MLYWYLGFIVPVPTSLFERRTDGVDENRSRCINNQKVDRCKFFFKKNWWMLEVKQYIDEIYSKDKGKLR